MGRRGLTIDRPNQVWATDITYIPLAHGYFTSVLLDRGAKTSMDGIHPPGPFRARHANVPGAGVTEVERYLRV